MTSFKITFINELSGLKEIIDIPEIDKTNDIDSVSYTHLTLPTNREV